MRGVRRPYGATDASLLGERPAVGGGSSEVGVELREGARSVALPIEEQSAEADARGLRLGRVGEALLQRRIEVGGLLDVAGSTLRVRVAK